MVQPVLNLLPWAFEELPRGSWALCGFFKASILRLAECLHTAGLDLEDMLRGPSDHGIGQSLMDIFPSTVFQAVWRL